MATINAFGFRFEAFGCPLSYQDGASRRCLNRDAVRVDAGAAADVDDETRVARRPTLCRDDHEAAASASAAGARRATVAKERGAGVPAGDVHRRAAVSRHYQLSRRDDNCPAAASAPAPRTTPRSHSAAAAAAARQERDERHKGRVERLRRLVYGPHTVRQHKAAPSRQSVRKGACVPGAPAKSEVSLPHSTRPETDPAAQRSVSSEDSVTEKP